MTMTWSELDHIRKVNNLYYSPRINTDTQIMYRGDNTMRGLTTFECIVWRIFRMYPEDCFKRKLHND